MCVCLCSPLVATRSYLFLVYFMGGTFFLVFILDSDFISYFLLSYFSFRSMEPSCLPLHTIFTFLHLYLTFLFFFIFTFAITSLFLLTCTAFLTIFFSLSLISYCLTFQGIFLPYYYFLSLFYSLSLPSFFPLVRLSSVSLCMSVPFLFLSFFSVIFFLALCLTFLSCISSHSLTRCHSNLSSCLCVSPYYLSLYLSLFSSCLSLRLFFFFTLISLSCLFAFGVTILILPLYTTFLAVFLYACPFSSVFL